MRLYTGHGRCNDQLYHSHQTYTVDCIDSVRLVCIHLRVALSSDSSISLLPHLFATSKIYLEFGLVGFYSHSTPDPYMMHFLNCTSHFKSLVTSSHVGAHGLTAFKNLGVLLYSD